ncbi:unnamed protein product [Didymodactylos carnosus]|uniref:Uncharacterized protein n=1 Tax=Didymodactylos carnosus TaxID=1234261 RepID=A0A8S2WRQ0_9BILA|nr:unnamed protein product [Didymodactylos carnosus]CAF4457492.1 unnamed protein product [Didymodactylos carnosus]
MYDKKNTFDSNEIEAILNQEILGKTILENLNTSIDYKAGNSLLLIVNDGQKLLSTFNMNVLESCLKSDETSIELKLLIIKIFKNV